MSLVECVPNFSDGRRPEVLSAIRDAIASVPEVAVLDTSSDASHNRSVVTFVAPAESVVEAAFQGIRAASELIDLTVHEGAHPRIGATDVCPFIPIEGVTMADCVQLARSLGERVGAELGIPVFLYERAATRSDRENLAAIRRGEFEAARDEIGTNPDRVPDFGPNAVHPTAGATVIGARPFLVAYNVYLGGVENLQVAKDVAKAVRGSSGGLRHVKGLGLEVDGQAQVSMNLVDTDATPLSRAYDLVRMEAEARGVTPTRSELVGLVPEKVLFETAARHIRLPELTPEMVLEHQIRQAQRQPRPEATAPEVVAAPDDNGITLDGYVASVAAAEPVPGGGSVVAIAGQLAAGLTHMVSGLTAGRAKYADVDEEMRVLLARAESLGGRLGVLASDDSDAYLAVSSAYRLPKDDDAQRAARTQAINAALATATEVPLETARACRDVAELAAACASKGNRNAVSDSGVAALLAHAACRGAGYNVRINVASMADPSAWQAQVDEAAQLEREAAAFATQATAEVEATIG